MAKPDINTPIETLSQILDAAVAWFNEHKAALTPEVGPSYDGAALATDRASALRQTSDRFLQEQVEDRQVFTDRDATLADARALLTGVRASARRRTRGRADADRIMAAFRFGRISRLNDTDKMAGLLRKAAAALNTHAAALDRDHERTPTLLARIDDVMARLKANAEAKARENQETRAAWAARQEARQSAIDLVDDLADAAEAVAHLSPEPLAALRVIFDTHNPTSRGGGTTDEEDGGELDDEPVVDDSGEAPGEDEG